MSEIQAIEWFEEWLDDYYDIYDEPPNMTYEIANTVIAALREKAEREKGCEYCNHENNDFVILNQDTYEYSGITICINRQGLLRTRAYNCDGNLVGQEVISVDSCPKCGRKFEKQNNWVNNKKCRDAVIKTFGGRQE